MGWDATRSVPWKRFVREWAIYAVVFAVAVLVVKRGDVQPSQFVWIVLSLPIWVGFSGLLAKFGYQRKTLKDIRAETAARAAEQQAARSTAAATGRARPAPTKRTSTGPNRPSNKGKRR